MPSINQSQRDALALGTLGEHVAKAAATLPATTTQHLFVITGGRVLVSLLFGQVTTIIQSTDPVAKITATPTTGTAVDIASTVDLSSLEVGGKLIVEGDGTALIKGNAGAGFWGNGAHDFIVETGYLDLITGATKTGATKWDVFYVPIDDGALVVSG
jgi:hypothetical protein